MRPFTSTHFGIVLVLSHLLLAHSPLAAQDIVVRDDMGREVRLSEPARRIVALAPHIVENLYSAGAGDVLVGAASYSDFPPPARKIPVVGSYRSFSLETILSLEPDLIITWASGNGMASLADLQNLGVPVFASEPRLLGDISESIRLYGKLAGSSVQANAEADRIEAEFLLLRETFSQLRRVSVFYQIWHEPLQTLNGDHMVNDVIDICGATNSFADAQSLAPRISLESVLQRNPDMIVASGADRRRPPWLDLWRAYPSLSAVANNALFFINPDHIQRPTARALLGAARLCQQVHSVRQQKPLSRPYAPQMPPAVRE